MSTTELRSYVDARTPEERRWLSRYLWEKERSEDAATLAELDRRMDDLDSGRNAVSWSDATRRLDKLEHQP